MIKGEKKMKKIYEIRGCGKTLVVCITTNSIRLARLTLECCSLISAPVLNGVGS